MVPMRETTENTMYRLHGFSQSGNAYKVALLLQALRQPWDPVHLPFEQFAAGIQRTDAFRNELNAMGEVPILEFDGRKLTQSAVILHYLADKHGEYYGDTESDRLEVLRWLFFDNHKFTSYLASWRFTKSFMPTPPDPGVEKWLKGRIDNAFGIVEKHLAAREYIVGSRPTIADMSMCGYLYFPADESGYDIPAQFPAMARWLERLKALPGWKHPYDMLPGQRVAPRW
jgi:glutathione S-transferase